MPEPTKGPWWVEPEPDASRGFMVMAADTSEHADAGDLRIVASYATEPDARLIAAAPELLEHGSALFSIVNNRLIGSGASTSDPEVYAAIVKALHGLGDAIEKATR